MAIEDRNLKPGTKLVVTYKKVEYRAEMIAGEDGKVRYRLEDGREFKSPSSAGTGITGKACNGWTFWSVEDSYEWAAAGAGDETVDGKAAESEGTEPTPSKAFRRVPNQKGVPDGDVRLFCVACGKSFTTASGALPDHCPEGHSPDDAKEEATTE